MTNPPSKSGEKNDLGKCIEENREQLRRMVDIRLDPRLRQRIDASDVVQEACVEAMERLPQFAEQQKMTMPAWLRFITSQKLLQLYRRHIKAEKRDAGREQAMGAAGTGDTTVVLADAIAASGMLSPSGVMSKEELKKKLIAAIEKLDEGDREVILMRYFEELPNREVARILGLSEAGASLRCLRAMQHLSRVLRRHFGGEFDLEVR